MAANEVRKFTGLPLSAAQPIDIGRLVREVDKIDEDFRQGRIRDKDKSQELPKLSPKLKDVIEFNKVDLLNDYDRTQLLRFLEAIKDRAPRVHISFASEPGDDFLLKIMTWLRKELHPLVLLTVGLEPGIGAGSIVRTTNKYFSFTLTERLKHSKILIEKIKEMPLPEAAANAQPQVAEKTKEAVK